MIGVDIIIIIIIIIIIDHHRHQSLCHLRTTNEVMNTFIDSECRRLASHDKIKACFHKSAPLPEFWFRSRSHANCIHVNVTVAKSFDIIEEFFNIVSISVTISELLH